MKPLQWAKRRKFLTIFLMAVLLLMAAIGSGVFRFEARPFSANDTLVVTTKIYAESYYVPKIYMVLPSRGFSENSIYVRAMFPAFGPAFKSPSRLLKQEEWHKSIDILAHRPLKPMLISVL